MKTTRQGVRDLNTIGPKPQPKRSEMPCPPHARAFRVTIRDQYGIDYVGDMCGVCGMPFNLEPALKE